MIWALSEEPFTGNCNARFVCTTVFANTEKNVELMRAKLHVIELECTECCGTLSFWCDFFQEDPVSIQTQIDDCAEV